MNRTDLRDKLNSLRVKPELYSLEGELLPDRIILYNSYNTWEVFYLGERGERSDMKLFSSEDEACEYIYVLFKEAKEIEDRFFK